MDDVAGVKDDQPENSSRRKRRWSCYDRPHMKTMSQENDKPFCAEKATQTDNWFNSKPENDQLSTDSQTNVRVTILNIIKFVTIVISP